MKKFVVAIVSFFENEVKQFKIEAESEYEAVKKAMVEFTGDEYKQSEIDLQNSKDYPQSIEEQNDYYLNCEMSFSVIEI